MAAERSIQLHLRLDSAHVFGDRDRLGEAVANIISNAIRYNKQDGQVDVDLSAPSDEIRLRVADTGRGIPEPELRRVFDRFYRSDQARTRTVEGSGLGLAIAKWIVEAHGGSIRCENRPSGGALFHLSLPRVDDA
jgi:signal transduction histidine kinase